MKKITEIQRQSIARKLNDLMFYVNKNYQDALSIAISSMFGQIKFVSSPSDNSDFTENHKVCPKCGYDIILHGGIGCEAVDTELNKPIVKL